MKAQRGEGELFLIGLIVTAMLVGITGIGGCMYIGPQYGVWEAQMRGKAQLAEAESGKQVAVKTAKAKSESAKYEAESEIIRAGGVAKANAIIGQSLRNNEEYLKYLWINQLEGSKNAVVYVPTEANLPLLEAGHRPATKQ